MCTYLASRGATYYFRRGIPLELQPALDGRREFMFSLRTKDRATAKQLIPAHTIETDRLLGEARARLTTHRHHPDGQPGGDAMASSEHDRGGDGSMPAEQALTEAQREEAEFKAQEADAAAERRKLRKPARDEFRRRMAFSTAELSPTEQVARDLLRDREEEIRAFRMSPSAEDGDITASQPRRE